MEVSGTKKYYPELDIVKGIAILLVILGHSFCTFPFDLMHSCRQYLARSCGHFRCRCFSLHRASCFHVKQVLACLYARKCSA